MRSSLLSVVVALLLIGFPSHVRAEADENHAAQPGAITDSLAEQLKGAWVFVENEENAKKVAPGIGRLQFFTGKNWVMTHPNPTDHEVIFHHGGTYTLEGNELIKTVEYAMDSTRKYIGTTRRFRIKLEGDLLIQVAMDPKSNPFTEVWERVK